MQKYLIVPITVYEGKVEIINDEKIHPLHKHLLKYICLEHKLENVINNFGLDRRITEEAIIDLMYKEMVYVDFENAVIYPTHEVETQVDQGRLETFLGINYPDIVRIKWVQDNLTGHICTFSDVRPHLRKPMNLYDENYDPNSRIHLNHKEFLHIKNISPETLIKIAKMELRIHINEGSIFQKVKKISELRVIDIKTLYIPLKQEEINGKLYEIPISDSIPNNIIESWNKSITTLDPYTISDQTKIDKKFHLKYDWGMLLRSWEYILQRLGEIVNQGFIFNRFWTHLDEIINFIENDGIQDLLPIMYEIGAKTSNIDISFAKGKEILNKLEEKIKNAKDFVIIGSAFLNEQNISEILALFQNNNPNLNVLFIWGGLGEPISNLKSKFPIFGEPNFHLISGIDRFHSKFLLIDHEISWITSCNLLSYYFNGSSAEEIICEFNKGLIINDIIEYIRNLIPGSTKAKIKFDEYYIYQEKSEIIALQYQNLTSFEKTIKDLLETLKNITKKTQDADKLEFLKKKFEELKDSLKKLRKTETAVMIEDLEHRKLLRSCLSQAKNSIHIGTDRINKNAISMVLISSLNQAMDNKVKISVKWGRENPDKSRIESYESCLHSIDYMNSNLTNKLNLEKKPSHSHSKYMIFDHRMILVTSFNLFAFSGNGLSNEEITKELGVVISSQKCTKNIIDILLKK